jgi:predicted O-methyltransferase YrrM
MSDEMWGKVDAYFTELFKAEDSNLQDARHSAAAAGLPDIAISPMLGRTLHVLVRLVGARRVLEIGTLGGYSTIWMARALPDDGELLTLEYAPAHAAVARANLERAGLGAKVTIIEGDALHSLARMTESGQPPFDMVFIDADKENYVAYLDYAIRLCRPGALIIADNVVRAGRVLDPASTDTMVQGIRAFNAALSADPRIEATALQTVGAKGYDGLAMAVVKLPE